MKHWKQWKHNSISPALQLQKKRSESGKLCLNLSSTRMAYSEAKSYKKLYVTLLQEIITKMFKKYQMLDSLIIFVKLWKLNFVKLCRNRFLKKYVWDQCTLHCEHFRRNAWNYSVDYMRGSGTPAACKTNLLVSIVHNIQLLTVVTKNSILDAAAPKLYFILICFCFKWLLQNIMFMCFSSIQKILSNWYKIRKSIELHWKPIDMISTW